MKVVNLVELLNYPPGIIFSVWEPCISRDLCIKGSSLPPLDFWYRSLLPWAADPDDPPTVDDAEGRWGLYDGEQLFCVYEDGDLEELFRALNHAIIAGKTAKRVT